MKKLYVLLFLLNVCISANSQVGIGTTNPKSKLEVVDSGTAELRISSTSGFGPARLSFISDKDTGVEWRPAFIESSDSGGFTGRLNFYTNGGGSGNFFTSKLAMSIYDGNVGIGSISPSNKLEVVGNTKTTNFQMTTGATANYVLQSDAAGNATWVNPGTAILSETDPKISSATTNKIPKWNGTNLVDGLIFDNATNVGIGTNNPQSKLEVVSSGTTELKISSISGFGAGRLSFISDKNTGLEWRPAYVESSDAGGFTGRLDFYTNGSGNGNFFTSKLAMSVFDGKLGIGINNPSNKLKVVGNTKTTNLQMTTGATANYVLQSDASGNATWVNNNGGFTHYLGELYLGGVIFELYKGSDGLEHGLVVALTESTNVWQSTISLNGANRTEDGAFNTNLMTNSPAATYIATLGAGWYLPSIDELIILLNNRFYVNKALRSSANTLLTNGWYASSTEFDTNNYIDYSFEFGRISKENKSVTEINRGVKSF